MFKRALLFSIYKLQMNIKYEPDFKGTPSDTKRKQSSVLGEMIGQRHLKNVEVECGGEVEFGRGCLFKAAERFYSDTHPTCYDM